MGETILTNRKAFRDYFFTNKWECGIELMGCEVKSIRNGHLSFNDAFARFEKSEIFLYNLHIDPYQQASYQNVEPDRIRKLLLRKPEIKKIYNECTIKGLTLIPTKMYFNKRGFVKVEIALAKGKKSYDKREAIKNRDSDRDISRALRSSHKGK